jgi:hypothetical protein
MHPPTLRFGLIGVLALALLGGLGAAGARFLPTKPPAVSQESLELRQHVAALTQANNTLVAEVNANRTTDAKQNQAIYEANQRLANVKTGVREVVYRGNEDAVARLLSLQYAKLNGSAPNPALPPVINVSVPPGDKWAQPAPNVTVNVPESKPTGGYAPLPPVEVVVRDTRIEDTSVTKSETKMDTATEVKTVETQAAKVDSNSSSTTEVKSDTEVKTEKTVKSSPPKNAEPGRLGVGGTTGFDPFVSYDLAKVPLGPRFLGLGGLGAGVYLTGNLDGSNLDGGPQINYQKSRLFGLVGYGLRDQEVDLGIGIKF